LLNSSCCSVAENQCRTDMFTVFAKHYVTKSVKAAAFKYCPSVRTGGWQFDRSISRELVGVAVGFGGHFPRCISCAVGVPLARSEE
jgi:hypothetical protein